MTETTETLNAYIVNALTGEFEVRELNPDEISERENFAVEQLQQEAELQIKTLARQSALAKLAALGLTQQEIESL